MLQESKKPTESHGWLVAEIQTLQMTGPRSVTRFLDLILHGHSSFMSCDPTNGKAGKS
jgi:hypothetical protein